MAVDEPLESSVARGARWVTASTLLTAASVWATALVLARLLDRHTFGLAALALLAVAVLQLFQDSGLHAALIQRRGNVESAADAASLYAPLTGLALAALCFAVAPLAGLFFHDGAVPGLVRGLAAMFVLRGFAVTPTALIQRELRFRRLAVVTIGSALLSFATAACLAVAGAGAWAVIGAQVVAAGWSACSSMALSPYRPSPRRASLAELRSLLRYGRHIVAGNVVGFVNSNTDPIGVGRLYGPPSLGAYTIGFNTGSQAVTMMTGVANVLVFPAYAKLQDDRAHFRRAYLRSLRFLSLISPPLAFGLAAVSSVAIPVLYGARWHHAIPVLAIISFYGLFLSISATTGEVFKAAGRPDLFFRMGVYQVVLLFALIGVLYRFGIAGFAAARAGATIVMSIVALVVAGRILGLRFGDWRSALLRPTAAAALMGAAVLATRVVLSRALGVHGYLLVLLIGEGAVVYPVALAVLAPSRLHEFISEVTRVIPIRKALPAQVGT